MIRPNFFIIGAPKAGTTSLYHYCAQHPDVFMCQPKEPAFFCTFDPDCHKRNVLERGDKRWQQIFHFTLDEYAALFADADKPVIGEASTAYLSYFSQTACWIRKICPEARIVAVLREPIDRLISDVNMQVTLPTAYLKPGHGVEPLVDFLTHGRGLERPSFSGIVKEIIGKVPWGTFGLRQRYEVRLGLYADAISHFRKYFGERLHVIKYDDLHARPENTLRSLFDFLGVRPFLPADMERLNTAEGWQQRGKTALLTKRDVHPAALAQLRRLYRPDIESLQPLVPFSVADWLT
jgi:hypothetical protein